MENFQTGIAVYHDKFGTGRVVRVEGAQIIVNFIKAGVKFLSHEDARAELSLTPPDTGGDDDMDMDELKETIREVLREEGLVGKIPMAEKWEGGELVMKAGKEGLQPKSVPIDLFFHKIVMIRNQLRVLEANINASKNLNDAEKVDLQQYLTRCYGTLTTFNVLFADRADWFVGSGRKDED
jgi:hypothetical protein